MTVTEKEMELVKLLMADCETTGDIQKKLKRLFAGTIFSNTQNGATASALIYSLAVTACANGLNVEDYFFRLLTSDEPVMPWNE